jgi:hypothetical protein
MESCTCPKGTSVATAAIKERKKETEREQRLKEKERGK